MSRLRAQVRNMSFWLRPVYGVGSSAPFASVFVSWTAVLYVGMSVKFGDDQLFRSVRLVIDVCATKKLAALFLLGL